MTKLSAIKGGAETAKLYDHEKALALRSRELTRAQREIKRLNRCIDRILNAVAARDAKEQTRVNELRDAARAVIEMFDLGLPLVRGQERADRWNRLKEAVEDAEPTANAATRHNVLDK